MNHREKPSFGSGEDKSDDEDDKADESVKEKEVQEENKITAQSSLSFQAAQSPIFMVPCPSRLSTRMPSSKLSKPTPAFLPSSVAFHGREFAQSYSATYQLKVARLNMCRVGQTARAGKGREAWSIVAPSGSE